MARSRIIRPEFFDDEKLAEISIGARLTFIGLWVYSDDYGVVKGNARWLQSRIFPYGDVESDVFDQYLVELTRIDVIRPFSHNGERYLWIKNFHRHQKINRPSETRNPSPPEELLADSPVTHGGLTEDSLSPHGALTAKTETETETETETPLPLASEGSARVADVVSFVRRDKSKPRELGTNPRAQGTNPRAVGANPRAQPDFEAFWKAYPRKVGKKAALKAWLKATDKPPLEEILAALEAQKQSPQWQKDGGQFIPLPATWLNQGRWADEMTPAEAAGLTPAKPRADPACPDCRGEGWVHFERDGRQFSRRCKCWRARDD